MGKLLSSENAEAKLNHICALHKPMALQPAKTGEATHLYKQAENGIFSETFSVRAKIIFSLDSEDSEERSLLLAVDAPLQRIRRFSTSPLWLSGELERANFL